MTIRIKQAEFKRDNKELIKEIENALRQNLIMIEPVGSRITCNPAPENTDQDWLILVDSSEAGKYGKDWKFDENRLLEIDDQICSIGYECEGSVELYTGDARGSFRSWRKGDVNLIVTHEHAFFDRFITATHLAHRFNLLKKSDRISLFQAVLYNARWDEIIQ